MVSGYQFNFQNFMKCNFLDPNDNMCGQNIDVGELPFSFHEEKSFNCIIENSHTVIHAHGGRAYALGCTPFESGIYIFLVSIHMFVSADIIIIYVI